MPPFLPASDETYVRIRDAKFPSDVYAPPMRGVKLSDLENLFDSQLRRPVFLSGLRADVYRPLQNSIGMLVVFGFGQKVKVGKDWALFVSILVVNF